MKWEFTDKKIFILGAGGISGKAMVNLVRHFTDRIYVYDQNQHLYWDWPVVDVSNIDVTSRKEIIQMYEKYNFDFCFISPGFPRNSLVVRYLEEKNIPVIGEMDLGFYVIVSVLGYRPYIIGVTGTDGKSTTTYLIAELFRSQGISAIECGNYGVPLSEIALQYWEKKTNMQDVFVVECSSYQLEKIFFFKPQIAILLNIAEDHLDRYNSLREYILAKMNIFSLFSSNEDKLLLSLQAYENIIKYQLKEKLKTISYQILSPVSMKEKIFYFQGEPFLWEDFRIDNYHNRQNLMFALETLKIYMEKQNLLFYKESLQNVLKHCSGLPHRLEIVLEMVKERKTIIFVNDSKSTTVQALLSALKTFEYDHVLLLMGGVDKHLNYQAIKNLAMYQENRLFIFPFGSSAQKIKEQLGLKKIYFDMEEAFKESLYLLKKMLSNLNRVIVLLSPACASFDQYKNYKERGEHFRFLVKKYNTFLSELIK